METVIQEDADAVGISILSGAHTFYFNKIIDLLKEKDASDVIVFGGGVIPDADIPGLLEAGAGAVFGPGTPTPDCVEWLEKAVVEKRAKE